jgi:hypothetical protein
MCSDYNERRYWILRIEQMRKEMEKADELKKQSGPATPAKLAEVQSGVRERQPVPA